MCYDWLVPALFAPIYPDELQISFARIHVLVSSYSERGRTGIIRLGYPPEKYLYLLFKRGELLNSYLASPPAPLETLGVGQWEKWAEAAGDAYTRVVSLSTQGLFISKLLINAGSNKTENFSTPARLSGYISLFEGKAEAALLHVNWDHAMGGIFFPGSDDPIHSIFISQAFAADEAGVNQDLVAWNEANCTVKTAFPDLSIDTWREYYLRMAFSKICHLMLARFELMTGRALVDSLVRLVSTCAARNNMDILISSRKVVDNEIFPSSQEAARGYRTILGEMFNHFSAVVGSRLLSLTMQEIVASLSELERSVIRASQLLPEGYVHESKSP